MGPNKVGGGAQALELNGLSWGTVAFWDRVVTEAAPGTCVLEAGEGHLRLGRLALCGRPAPSAVARSLQGRLDSWHRRRWHCQESGALAKCGQNDERPTQPHTSPTRDLGLGNLLPFTLGPEQSWVSSASAKPTSFSSH